MSDDEHRPDEPAGPPAAPAGQLLQELAGLRRRTRAARHAYWFPLVLFGLLTLASAPLYLTSPPGGPLGPGALSAQSGGSVALLALGGVRHQDVSVYWLFALTGGYWVSAAWYRWHARRVGVATPWRGFLVTGIAFTAASILAFVVPLTPFGSALLPGDLVLRGTFPFLIIAAGLWVLARAERSWGLAVIAAVYTSAALVSALYNVENVVFRLGFLLAADLTALPGVLLPAVILLVAGLAALAVQRPRRAARLTRAGAGS